MLFRHPKLLYALFALLIPIIIHLFKLRKFRKVAFTNVALLEKVKLQSRKSAQLKKWLVLLSRLTLLACIVLAFAKPYLPATSKEEQPDHYIVYLDNSYSMQAEGSKGELLQRAIQDLIPQLQEIENFSFFTNTSTWENANIADIQNDLLQIDYTNEQLSPDQIILKAKQLGKAYTNASLISISDFQEKGNDYSALLKASKGIVNLKAIETNNIAIDSLWLDSNKKETLNIALSNTGKQTQTTLSIFNDDELLGRSTIDFKGQSKVKKTITLPNNKNIKGKAVIVDNGLGYDNSYYFSINPSSLSNIISIGKSNQEFLERIYTEDEFSFSTMLPNAINFAALTKANTIILNEVQEITKSLENLLIDFLKNKGNLIVIPSETISEEFIGTLKRLSGISISELNKSTKKITQINFGHPSYKGVFTKSIDNFQYPEAKTTHQITSEDAILKFEDNSIFLGSQNQVYVFATSLAIDNCNFLNSPLVVPTFYKLGLKQTENQSLSYTIGKANTYSFPISLDEDQVIQLQGEKESFIPFQQTYSDHIKINTTELPKKSGNYSISIPNNSLKAEYSVSYNYSTSESKLQYANLDKVDNVYDSVESYFSQEKAGFETTDLWKWFIIFALIFLLIEILLLKFLK